jgi:putative ABC transport system permease protein
VGAFSNTCREIFLYLRQYKSRTAMTLFGLIWGTVTVIVLLAFGAGVRVSMSKNMHGMGEGIAIVWPGRTSVPYKGYGRDRGLRLRADDAELLRHEIPEIEAISPEYSKWNTPVKVGEQVLRPNISGSIPEYAPMRNIWPQPGGRWLNDLDLKERRRVAFLGYKAKEFLFGKESGAAGKYVLLGDSPFLVIGVLKEKTQPSSYNARDQDRVFIPSTTFESTFGNRYIENLVYKPRNARQAKTVQSRIYEVLGKKYIFDPKDKQALGIWDTTEMDQFVFFFSLGLNIFMLIIGALTLTVGGIGLANIMYVVVQERTREIGVRRSIGARRSHIMGQFMTEAFFIVGIGGTIGFAISVLLIKLISLIPKIDEYVGRPVLSFKVALTTIVILGVVGFLSGFFPARRAARLNVADCLRA